MARQPLRDRWASELPVLLLLLLLRPPQTPGTTCATPTSIEHANIQVKSYNENSRERYICNSGFKRKAGDPSLTHQRPSSTVAPAGVTPEPESPSPSGKEPAFISKPDTIVATKPAMVPGSRLMPSKPPAGTTGVVRNEPSQAPPQTTAKALEHIPPPPSRSQVHIHPIPQLSLWQQSPYLSLCFVEHVWYYFWYVIVKNQGEQTSRTPSDQMENTEDIPMTGGTNGREEDTENYHTV
ncbi:hypothetical protein QTO34_008078 [Cnephaeus nilssonii]|uniref:Sushi domain-containing protein n=1 Tax=Cnephaeus nilssonii TaxID=3371016 RepID=A0AA40LTF1_CNENI|nr:hypothetical protein QTO34_008078 [Eptesicus nilssonii]